MICISCYNKNIEGQKKKDLPEIKYLLVLDFEATCDDKAKLEGCSQIIEFPCIVVNTETLAFEAEFHQYVKPRFNPQLTQFCNELTGITQQMVEKGQYIEYVLDDFYKWIESLKFLEQGNYTFVTCGDWDLNSCLRKEAKQKGLKIPQFLKKYINIKKYFVKVMKSNEKCRGMMQMLQVLGVKHQGKHHSGIDDVKNICQICIQLIKTHKAKFNKHQIVESKY